MAVAVLAVSTSAVIATWLLGDPPEPRLGISVALWRCAGGATVLALVALRSRRVRLDARQWRWITASGVFLAVHFALFHAALGLTSVAAVTTLVTLSPVFVAIGARVFLHEPPSRMTVLGVGITVVAGVALTASDVLGTTSPTALAGDLMALAAAAAVAGTLLVGRRHRAAVPAAQYSAVVFGAATITLVVVALLADAPLAPWSGRQWWAVAAMVAGPQLLGHFLLQTVLSDLPPTLVATAVLAEPVIGSLLAWWLLGQLPPTGLLLSGPVVLLGVALAARGTTRDAAPVTTTTTAVDAAGPGPAHSPPSSSAPSSSPPSSPPSSGGTARLHDE
nr:DMT family transporter [Salsipaludibacter albus]